MTTACHLQTLLCKTEPLALQTDASCFAPCTEAAVPITANPDSAVVTAITEHEYRKQCELRRRACADALQRGITAGVIR